MESKTLFKGFFDVRRDWIGEYPYDVLMLKGDAVSVIVETAPNTLLLQWEFRYPTQKRLLATVGGLIDGDETPLEAAERELLEETGYRATHFKLLGQHYPFPGITGQKLYVVVASGAQYATSPTLDPLELIEVEEVRLERLQEMVSNVPVDGVLLSSLLLYQWHLNRPFGTQI